jgi:predicted ester cyclase
MLGSRHVNQVVGNFAKSIPDMKFDIKEVLVAGDRVIVRGEVTGTPAGELFGVAHTGNSFEGDVAAVTRALGTCEQPAAAEHIAA